MKRMSQLLAVCGVVAVLGTATSAFAGGSFGFSFGYNSGYRHSYCAPRYSVYYGYSYYPRPYYYCPPPVVTYYSPPVYYYYGGRYYCR
jgi:hypothetical protein